MSVMRMESVLMLLEEDAPPRLQAAALAALSDVLRQRPSLKAMEVLSDVAPQVAAALASSRVAAAAEAMRPLACGVVSMGLAAAVNNQPDAVKKPALAAALPHVLAALQLAACMAAASDHNALVMGALRLLDEAAGVAAAIGSGVRWDPSHLRMSHLRVPLLATTVQLGVQRLGGSPPLQPRLSTVATSQVIRPVLGNACEQAAS